ncbi:hypothetical protein LTR35_012404 [Friedmanniomyces endolithicus]|uniref:Mso1 N-terminal domain-containing protein n=1 Tax=Friedmanniomyces endolithicus TaxID=329885 RepID=A0AAN6FDH9_9PEZI|nr:hypothetical protein LTR35_012404 [Friedmanniomyces endolithicus]KAK0281350.1 hypothetical protein LTS00_012559 [Friedmanniomyces endolithicus]KAK0313439.1 hypothetical protein LTR82_013470 [Friedmanniomyces endolithicus]KAK1015284.1 hypothetical protein LTR54_003827 [Friedmanniomyces endolithicus]
MSSYLSSLLTSTTSRYNTLRRTLLSNEDDGDTEDDSHISRVLRAYYTEKARPYPPWLPPDPNDRRAITPQPYAAAGVSGGQQQGGGGYFPSARNQPQYSAAQNAGGQRGSLSDLWDPPATSASPTPPMQPQSLRAGVRRGVQPSSHPSSTLAPPPVQARPLPSQRAGSQQNVAASSHQQAPYQQGMERYAPPLQGARGMGGGMEQSPPGSSSGAGGGTAQDRLKARLWGGQRTGSSTSVGSASNAGRSTGLSGGDGGRGAGAAGNPYGTSANAPWSSNGGGDAYDGYDTGGRNPYDTGGGAGGSGGAGQGGGGQGQGANSRRYGRTG